MLPESLRTAAVALFSICAAASALDTLVGDGRSATAFHAVCALAATLCAARAALPFIGIVQD